MARRKPDIYIVGENIDKHAGYFGKRDGKLVAISQGVYLRTGADPVKVFKTYGFRIAASKFRSAALTHSSAWFRTPVEVWASEEGSAKETLESVDVYIGGDFAYPPVLIAANLREPGQPTLRIIQSDTKPDLNNPELYEKGTFKDPLGKFEMYVSTPELTALQTVSVYRKHAGKVLDEKELAKLAKVLLRRHKNDPYAVASVVDRLSQLAGAPPVRPRKHYKDGEDTPISPFERFIKILFPLLREQA